MRSLLAGLALTLAGIFVSAQVPAGLKIVVLEGENAVNIIQQKTAVRALVEVRDRNNLPVSGATVTFAVAGQGGVIGASTVTVTTNAIGQAALAGVTPATTGSVQISVTAAFNELAATATITQTNVATAAAAASTAAGATGSATGGTGTGTAAATSGAAAGGGGLGTGAVVGIIGGVGAIAGGAAVLGAASGDKGDDGDNGSSGTSGNNVTTQVIPPCTFTIAPAEDLLVPIAGASYGFTITAATTTGCNPEWTIDTNLASAFVTANPVRGSGSASFTLTFASFTPTQSFPSRSGVVGVAGKLIRFFQPTRF